MITPKKVRVAVTQAEPVWFDLEGSINKTIRLIREASLGGARVVSFPECWIPGYPLWIWKYPVRPDFAVRYLENSLVLDSIGMRSICDAAKSNDIVVVLGYSERSGDTLYIGQCIISSEGEILMARRKLKPTHMERTIFGDAADAGCTLKNVVTTVAGKIGALSCWEHLQPLLKYHTISQRPQIHVAGWPPISTTETPQELYSMSKEGCKAISQVFAMESQSFVLHVGTTISALGVAANETQGAMLMSKPGGGSSIIYAPDGRPLTEDIKEEEEGIVYADLDMDLILVSKGFIDPVGHYSRPDLLSLCVAEGENKCVYYEGRSDSGVGLFGKTVAVNAEGSKE